MNRSPQPVGCVATQLALEGFGGPTARRTDPETSIAAGQAVAKSITRRSILRELVHATLRAHPAGLTDDELKVLLPGHNEGSVSKRRHDLAVEGLVVATGSTRPTRWGSEAMVWRVTS